MFIPETIPMFYLRHKTADMNGVILDFTILADIFWGELVPRAFSAFNLPATWHHFERTEKLDDEISKLAIHI